MMIAIGFIINSIWQDGCTQWWHLQHYYKYYVAPSFSGAEQALIKVETEGGAGWSIDQLLYNTIPSKVIEIVFLDYYTVVRAILLLAFIIPLLYPLLHKILKRLSSAYNSFDLPKQVVVLHHTLEFAILAGMMPFFSYYMIRIHFKVYSTNEANSFLSDARSTVILAFVIVVMYLNEITSRFMNPNPIVLFHHCVTVVDGILWARKTWVGRDIDCQFNCNDSVLLL